MFKIISGCGGFECVNIGCFAELSSAGTINSYCNWGVCYSTEVTKVSHPVQILLLSTTI